MTQATETPTQPSHQVMRSTESHFLDTNYLPKAHTTSQLIMARESLAQISYKFTEGVTEVKGLMGCEASPIEELGDGVYQSMLTLDKPLQPGEKAEIDLFTRFDFTELSPPPPRFRRRIIGAFAWDAFEVAVYFPLNNPPQRVAWAEWESYQSDEIVPGSEVPLKLGPMQSCSGEFLLANRTQRRAVSGKVLGVHWAPPA